MGNLMTAQEVADVLRLKYGTVLDYIRKGDLNAEKYGTAYRITEESLMEFRRSKETRREENARKYRYKRG